MKQQEYIAVWIRYTSSYSIGTMDIGMFLLLKKKNKLKRLFKDVDIASVIVRDRYAYTKYIYLTFDYEYKNNHLDEVISLVETFQEEINYLFPLMKETYNEDLQLFIRDEFDNIKSGTLRRYNKLWCVILK